MTAELRLSTPPEIAVLASPALLSLNDDGKMGVKLVGDDNRVVFHEVSVLSATADGVWLAGLPENARLITVGAGFVEPGDLVNPVPEERVLGGVRTSAQAEARS